MSSLLHRLYTIFQSTLQVQATPPPFSICIPVHMAGRQLYTYVVGVIVVIVDGYDDGGGRSFPLKYPRSRSLRRRNCPPLCTHRSGLDGILRPARVRRTHHAKFDFFVSAAVRIDATGCRTAVPGNTVVRFW